MCAVGFEVGIDVDLTVFRIDETVEAGAVTVIAVGVADAHPILGLEHRTRKRQAVLERLRNGSRFPVDLEGLDGESRVVEPGVAAVALELDDDLARVGVTGPIEIQMDLVARGLDAPGASFRFRFPQGVSDRTVRRMGVHGTFSKGGPLADPSNRLRFSPDRVGMLSGSPAILTCAGACSFRGGGIIQPQP